MRVAQRAADWCHFVLVVSVESRGPDSEPPRCIALGPQAILVPIAPG